MENSEEFQEYIKQRAEKRKSLKFGENVFQLIYFNEVLSVDDLQEYETELKSIQADLSSYDRSGDINASFSEFLPDIILQLSPLIVQSIALNTMHEASWELIKSIALKVKSKLVNKKIHTHTNGSTTSRDITFALKVVKDANTQIDFIASNLEDETLLKAFDKMIDVIKTQKDNSIYKHPYQAYYKKKKGKWILLDFEKEILKKSKLKKKK